MTQSRIILSYGILSFFIALLIGQKINLPSPIIDKQEAALNVKGEFLKVSSVGLKRFFSDLLWIQTLMESDLDHYKKKDLNSWLYLRFLTISKLDPKFYENFYYGGQYLMIVKDDLVGAESLLKRGLIHYDEDVGLNWQLGYMFAIEKKELEASLPFLNKIRFKPNKPKMFDSIYTKIVTNTLGPSEAYSFALSMWSQYEEGEPVKTRLEKQIYTLKAEIDLACLNSNAQDCDTKDFYGNHYIKKEGRWSAPQTLLNLKFRN